MELAILNWLQSIRTPALDRAMTAVTSLGDGGMIWILAAICLLLFPKTRKCGLTVLAALLLYQLLGNGILKNLVRRPRPFQVYDTVQLLIPEPGSYSFPSGHTGSSAAAAFVLAHAALLRKEFGNLPGKIIGIASLLLALLIGFSRMYLYVHWPSDVLGGLLLGVFCAWAAGRLLGGSAAENATGRSE